MKPEELEAALDVVEWGERTKVAGAKSAVLAHIAALEKERDTAWAERAKMCAEKHSALADNAALLEALDGATQLLAEYDAAGAEEIDRHIDVTDKNAHPGAALLEEVGRLREHARIATEHAVACATDRMRQTEEHRKALDEAIAKEREYRDQRIKEAEVRARNEGLEEALREVSAVKAKYGTDMSAFGALDYAEDRIRAMKEPEECTNASCVKCRNGEPCH